MPRLAALVTAALLAPRLTAAADDAALRHAREILQQVLVDTHNDLPWLIREYAGGDFASYDLRKRAPHETDLARLREGEGNVEAARQWLTTPQSALGGRQPLVLAKTDVGTREVEALIDRLEHGVLT